MKLFSASCVLLSIVRSADGGRVSHLRGRKNNSIHRNLQLNNYYPGKFADEIANKIDINKYVPDPDETQVVSSAVGKEEYEESSKIDESLGKAKGQYGDYVPKVKKEKKERCKSAQEILNPISEKKKKSKEDYSGKSLKVKQYGDEKLEKVKKVKSEYGICDTNRAIEPRDDTFSTPRDTDVAITAEEILVNDSNNGDSGTLMIDNYFDPTNGQIIMDPDGGEGFTYRPNPGFEGVDTIVYEVSDGVNEGSSYGTINIIVGSLENVAPEANDDVFQTTSCVSIVVPVEDIMSNDVDLNNDPLTVTGYSSPDFGIVTQNLDGGFTYTPNCDFAGSDTFTYVVDDGNGGVSIGTIIVDVFTGNQIPVANDDSFNVQAGTVAFRITLTEVLGNDVDPEGGDLTISSYTSPGNGILSRVPNGGFVYLPQGFIGQTSFTYTIVDPDGDSDTATVTLNIVNVIENTDPELTDDSYAAVSGEELIISEPGVLVNDSDPDGDRLSISGNSNPANGDVYVNEDGSFVYRPADDFVGVDQFTYTVSDGNGGSAVATVYINVKPPNSSPVAVNDSYTTPKDTRLMMIAPGVLENDSDPDSEDTLTVQSNSDPQSGSVNMNPDGSFVYRPNNGFTGTDSFVYAVTDGKGGTATATVYINVNQAPQAADDSYTTPQNTDLLVPPSGVLENDIDLDGDTLTIVKYDPPSNGNLVLNSDGSFTYRPDTDFVGVDTFTYTITDGRGGNTTPTVFINVVPLNLSPTATDDSYLTLKNTRLDILASDILSNDFDPENNPLNIELYSDPLNGHLHITNEGNFVYRPKNNFVGADSFTYTIIDGNGGTATATVFINVNSAPVAGDDRYSTPEGVTLMIPSPGVLANDEDMDGDQINIIDNTDPSNGVLTSFNPDGSFVYVPDPNFSGVDTFTYTVTDEDGSQITPTVFVTVIRANSDPVAVDDNYVTPINTPFLSSTPGLLGNDSDADGDDLTIASYTDTRFGDLVVNDDGSFVYVPNTNFFGTDTFAYVVKDDFGGMATADVIILINRPPNGNPDTYSTPINTVLNVQSPGVLSNDNDPDGDSLTVISSTAAANGRAIVDPDGSFVYTPNQGFTGSDTFTYTADDGHGGVVTVPVYINIVNGNKKPEASDDNYVTPYETDLVIFAPGVLSNDNDLNNDDITITANTNTLNGQLDLIQDGSFVYKPDLGFSGNDSFTYTVSDGNGGEANANVVIKVNRNPEGADDYFSVDAGGNLGIPSPGLLINDVDPDGDSLTICDNSNPSNGQLSIGVDGSFSYVPNADFSGTDSFTYKICDGFGGSSTSTVFISVKADNKSPTAVNDSYSTPKDVPLNIAAPGLLSNDFDPDDDIIRISALADNPLSGSLKLGSDGSFDYTPQTGFTGTDAFRYTISDTKGKTSTATVLITVLPPGNEAPIVGNDYYTTPEGTTLSIFGPGILGNDNDPNGDPLTVESCSNPSVGQLQEESNGGFTYTPANRYTGVVTFTCTIIDGKGGKTTSTTTITIVAAENNAPTASDDYYSTPKDTQLVINAPGILTNDKDEDGDMLTVQGNTSPQRGGFVVRNSDGSFIYTPPAGYIGPDQFTYTISDGKGGSDVATVFITIEDVNRPPTAVDDYIKAFQGKSTTIPFATLLANDNDGDGDDLSVVDTDAPMRGTLTPTSNGFIYRPFIGFTGNDFFTYAISDGNGAVVTAIVYLTVYNPPTAVDDSYTVFKNSRLTIPSPGILANDNSPENVGIRVSSSTQPGNGSLTQSPNGSFLYTPNTGFVGVDFYDYVVVDDNGGTAEATVKITIKTFEVPPMIIPGGGDVIIIGGDGVVKGTSSDCGLNFSDCTGVDTVSGIDEFGSDLISANANGFIRAEP